MDEEEIVMAPDLGEWKPDRDSRRLGWRGEWFQPVRQSYIRNDLMEGKKSS